VDGAGSSYTRIERRIFIYGNIKNLFKIFERLKSFFIQTNFIKEAQDV